MVQQSRCIAERAAVGKSTREYEEWKWEELLIFKIEVSGGGEVLPTCLVANVQLGATPPLALETFLYVT